MKLYISTGNSRMEKRWNGAEMELDEFIERISHTIRTAETVEQYAPMWQRSPVYWDITTIAAQVIPTGTAS